MLQVVRSRKAVVVAAIALATVAFACSDASGPTAPALPAQDAIISQTSNDVAPPVELDLYVSLRAEPRMVSRYGKRWTRLEGSCRHGEFSAEHWAVLLCPPDLAGRCMELNQRSEIHAGCVRMEDVRFRHPIYKITAFEVMN